MTESPVVTTRPDLDIMADIEHIITQYPPMMNDRHHVDIRVDNGKVTLNGNTRSSITKRYLVETVKVIPGVMEVDASEVYSDDAVRIDLGHGMPHDIFINVEYGVAILTGRLTENTTAEAVTNRARGVPGVRAVRSKFMR